MKKYLQLIIGIGIAAGAVWYTLRNISLTQLLDSLKQVNYTYLALGLPMLFGMYIGRAYRWQVLLQPLKHIPVKDIYSPLMIGFMGNVLPARAGEILRAVLVARKAEIPFTGAVATIVVERLFDLVMVLALFASVLVFYSDAFNSGISWYGMSLQSLASKFGWMALAFTLALIVFIYLLVAHRESLLRLLGWLLRFLPEKWQHKTVHLLGTFSEGLQVARNPAALVKIFIYTLITWGFIIASYLPFFFAFGIENINVEMTLLTVVMVCIFVTVLPTPAFLGSFQAGIMVAMHELLHTPEVVTASLAMVCWAVNFLVIVVLGVYFLLSDHISVSGLMSAEVEAEKTLRNNS